MFCQGKTLCRLFCQGKTIGVKSEGSAALRKDLRVGINEAVAAGARRFKACAIVGITLRASLRWRDGDVDRRSTRVQVSENSLMLKFRRF
jgi:hypothetical protein